LEDEKYIKIKDRLDRKLQDDYIDNPKRTIRKITVKNSPICSIAPDEMEQFWKARWEQSPNFNADETNRLYPVQSFFNKNMNEQIIIEILDKEKMMDLIKKTGKSICFRIRWDDIPFLEIRKRSYSILKIVMIRLIISDGRTLNIWKMGKTILIQKARNPNDPGNWGSSTLTSVGCRIIFERISQCLMQFENRSIKRGLISMSQK
jgi:hypothetical protein